MFKVFLFIFISTTFLIHVVHSSPSSLSSSSSPSLTSSSLTSSSSRSFNCTLYSSCAPCASDVRCLWCLPSPPLSGGCFPLPAPTWCASSASEPPSCPAPPPSPFSSPLFYEVALPLALLSLLSLAASLLLLRRDLRRQASLQESQSALPPSSSFSSSFSSAPSDASLESYAALSGHSDRRSLLSQEPDPDDDDPSTQPMFIGSLPNPDPWWRALRREALPVALLLGLPAPLALAVLALGAAEGSGALAAAWLLIVAVGLLVIPGVPLCVVLYRLRSRWVVVYSFYLGKMVLLRRNGVATRYALDAATRHESAEDRCARVVRCDREMTRISVENPRWEEAVVVHVASEDKFLFLRYLSYAISTELESYRHQQQPGSSQQEQFQAQLQNQQHQNQQHQQQHPASLFANGIHQESHSAAKQREWLDSSSEEDWQDRPVVELNDEPDWLDDDDE